MSNPLLEKYYEMFPEKKEEPKLIKAENSKIGVKLKPEFLEKLSNQPSITSVISNHTTPAVATSNTSITKASSLSRTTYDPDSVNVSFQQIAEKIKNGEAKVSSMSMERNIMYGTRITFEVYVND